MAGLSVTVAKVRDSRLAVTFRIIPGTHKQSAQLLLVLRLRRRRHCWQHGASRPRNSDAKFRSSGGARGEIQNSKLSDLGRRLSSSGVRSSGTSPASLGGGSPKGFLATFRAPQNAPSAHGKSPFVPHRSRHLLSFQRAPGPLKFSLFC